MLTIKRLEKEAGGENESSIRLLSIYTSLLEADMVDNIIIDPSITRGLDYYTGIVYETFLMDLPSIGSICSGGRYNDLASLYTKQKLPGVGSSIGLDRLLSALEELGSPFFEKNSSADILILNLDKNMNKEYQSIAKELREKNIRVDIYLETKKLPPQFKYAEQNNIPYGLFIKEDGAHILRDLSTRTDSTHSQINSIAASIQKGL